MENLKDRQARPDIAAERTGLPGRRGLLRCMTWAGAGVLWTVSGGVPRSRLLGAAAAATRRGRRSASCRSATAISASPTRPNTDTPGTLREAIGLVRRQKQQGAALMLHTGDVSQLSKPAQFDTARADHRRGRARRALRPRRARRAGR